MCPLLSWYGIVKTKIYVQVSLEEAQETVDLWYRDRREVRLWQEIQKRDALKNHCVYTILGRARHFPAVKSANNFSKGRIERAAINTPVQVFFGFQPKF